MQKVQAKEGNGDMHGLSYSAVAFACIDEGKLAILTSILTKSRARAVMSR